MIRQMLPNSDGLRADASEAACAAVAGMLPALVEAVKADSISTITRDRDGCIAAVLTVHQ